jgi:hypothetical protein
MASALALTTSYGDPTTYAEAMAGPLHDDCKRVVDEESTSIILNNTFTTVDFIETKRLFVKPLAPDGFQD